MKNYGIALILMIVILNTNCWYPQKYFPKDQILLRELTIPVIDTLDTILVIPDPVQ